MRYLLAILFLLALLLLAGNWKAAGIGFFVVLGSLALVGLCVNVVA